MKKNRLLWGGLLLISVLSAFTFSACDKDTWCYLEVFVEDQMTGKAAPDAHLLIGMDGTLADTGITNANGIYTTKFAAPAILNVKARLTHIDTLNPNVPYFRQGIKSVRLKEGETVQVTAVVEKDLHRGDIDNWEI